jgi:hypothetical protein
VEGLFAGVGESPVQPATELEARPGERRQGSLPLTSVRAAGGTTRWVKGNTYVVVQSFRGDARQDASRAKEFLAQHGIGAELVGGNDRGYRLIATTGFNFEDETQKKLAEQFLQKIRNVGRAYFQSGGRYKLEGYFATQTSDTW